MISSLSRPPAVRLILAVPHCYIVAASRPRPACSVAPPTTWRKTVIFTLLAVTVLSICRYGSDCILLHVCLSKILSVLGLSSFMQLAHDMMFHFRNLYHNFDNLGLAIPELHQLLILVHKFLDHEHLLPTAFVNYFTINSAVHLYIHE